jgi:sporulation protein YlmC with PRC-barrel domain
VPAVFAGGAAEAETETSERPVEAVRLQFQARQTVASLTGQPVLDDDGEEIGDVAGALVDLASGRVAYFVLRLEDVPDVENASYPVPPSLIYPNVQEANVMFPIEQADLLEFAPRMSSYPSDTGAMAWQLEVERFWRTADTITQARPVRPGYRPIVPARVGSYARYRPTLSAQVARGPIIEASRLRGNRVVTEGGARIGTVAGIVVSLGSASIPYVLVETDDQTVLRPVPLPLFSRAVDSEQFVFQGGASQLSDAPALAASNGELTSEGFASLRDEQWERANLEYWSDVDTSARYRYGVRLVPGLTLEFSEFGRYRVVNPSFQGLGMVEDLVVTLDGIVLYALVEFGGFLGLGSDLYPIPVSALEVDPYGSQLVIDLSRDELRRIPPIDPDMLPASSPAWDERIREHWMGKLTEVAGQEAGEGFRESVEQRTGETSFRASTVLGREVIGPEGTSIGVLEELLVQITGTAVAYPVIERTSGGETVWTPIPARALELDAADQTVRLNVAEQRLPAAPTYPFGLRPGVLQQTGWLREVREYWQRQ